MTELTALDDLARRGFSDGFRVVDGNLRVLTTGKLLRPEDLVIREVYRFEGVSDPDDMAVVFAIEGATGGRGGLIDAFGGYAGPPQAGGRPDLLIRPRAEGGRGRCRALRGRPSMLI